MERYWISLYPVSDYYRNNDEDGRLVRSKHRTVEFLTTMRYIERYIKTGDKVIEIGAGTGRYSLALADRGYRVDAVELVDHNIEIFKSKIKPGHEVTIRQGNALDLSFAADNSYDITLLLGPMYHLFTFGDKQRALSEALRVTKKGGPVFAAYCIADMSIFGYGFQGGNIHRLIEMGLIDTQTFKAKSTAREVFELHRKEDIDALMQGLPARRLHYAATDLYTLSMGEAVDAMDDETFALYLKYHYSICERPDMVGLTHHSLDVFRKL
ncbi:MAG: class I SAM-dependent methyltransferase [Oscillospiraceae bacterium]|nr:class I SAM-dependent methyltransferase [Oscillospiraceae bacterium]